MGDGRDEPAAPVPTTPDRDQDEVDQILDQVQALGYDRATELRRASYMPPKGRHASRWALTAAELTGRWREVTLSSLRRRLAEAEDLQAEMRRSEGTSEPETPQNDPQADAAWTQVLDELTLAERAGAVDGIAPHSVATWLRPLVAISLTPAAGGQVGKLVLWCPTTQHWIQAQANFGPRVASVAYRLGLEVEVREGQPDPRRGPEYGHAVATLQRREPGQQAQEVV